MIHWNWKPQYLHSPSSVHIHIRIGIHTHRERCRIALKNCTVILRARLQLCGGVLALSLFFLWCPEAAAAAAVQIEYQSESATPSLSLACVIGRASGCTDALFSQRSIGRSVSARWRKNKYTAGAKDEVLADNIVSSRTFFSPPVISFHAGMENCWISIYLYIYIQSRTDGLSG